MKKLSGKGRLSPSMVVAMLALVVALGAGAAYAKTHFLITSKSQIKPSLLKALKGARGADGRNGTNGRNGTDGRNGATGPTGPTGPQGAGAESLVNDSLSVGSTSPAVGSIPVQVECYARGGYTQITTAVLETTDTSGTEGLNESFGGNYYTTQTDAADTGSASTTVYSGAFGAGPNTRLNDAGVGATGEFAVGTVLLRHFVSTHLPARTTNTTETVTFDLTVATNRTCGYVLQIASSG